MKFSLIMFCVYLQADKNKQTSRYYGTKKKMSNGLIILCTLEHFRVKTGKKNITF